jgi:hypothetical protein
LAKLDDLPNAVEEEILSLSFSTYLGYI